MNQKALAKLCPCQIVEQRKNITTLGGRLRERAEHVLCRTTDSWSCVDVVIAVLDPRSATLPSMSFSSRRRNYLLTPHRRDGLIERFVSS